MFFRPPASTFSRGAKLLDTYFFLVFLVAFFFIVLLSLGLDLAAVLPGFLLTGITHLLLGSLLSDERENSCFVAPRKVIIEMRYVGIKSFVVSLERNFKAVDNCTVAQLSYRSVISPLELPTAHALRFPL
jgi:hypothetical protein